jgi:outer membrane biogenesis lipoprotein LolB
MKAAGRGRLGLPVGVLCAALVSGCATPSGSPHQSDADFLLAPPSCAPQAHQPQAPAQRPAPPATATTIIQGQMSLKLGAYGDQPAKGMSLGFFFDGSPNAGQLDLMTLMGTQVARIRWSPGLATLQDDHGTRSFADLEALSMAALGEALPLGLLMQWVQGHPAPGEPSQAGPVDGTFEQAGWSIDTRELDAKKLQATRGGDAAHRPTTIKIYLDR